MILIKIIFLLVMGFLWFLTQKLLGQRKQNSENEIFDLLHVKTERLNQYLNQNPRVADRFILASSLIIDLLMIFLIAQSIFKTTTQTLISIFIIFSLRQLNQFITALPLPKGLIWRDPGFSSLFVTYKVSGDLFFSGHTALAVLGALELWQLNSVPLMILGLFIVAFEMSVVLVLRAHWTIDIFTGAITAVCVYLISRSMATPVDFYLNYWLK
jgi:hypothetical protein